ncbi:MAG: flavin reductase [Bacteroidales bacterium]|jgi:flavin reductase (DIM6/NTAB) family NADH-FMN oxidoreductase RutF|nr:flavin reductase [Bacteroidales bacterium]
MHIIRKEIELMDRVKRLNLINSISGIKPANLIGSISKSGVSNLAIISSVIHLSSNPALIGFIARPHYDVRRDTLTNILECKYYTINHIATNFIERAHYTSTKFESNISEFDECNLKEEYIDNFSAPFVKESQIKFGLKLEEVVEIRSSKTSLIVGRIEHIIIPESIIDKNGYMELDKANSVGISGLNSYYNLKYITSFPYARINELPKFRNT